MPNAAIVPFPGLPQDELLPPTAFPKGPYRSHGEYVVDADGHKVAWVMFPSDCSPETAIRICNLTAGQIAVAVNNLLGGLVRE